jgi:hypothetical protein
MHVETTMYQLLWLSQNWRFEMFEDEIGKSNKSNESIMYANIDTVESVELQSRQCSRVPHDSS